jgi:hypothetical protein
MREHERWLILVRQVGLMTALPEVQAAMRAHAGVAAVAKHGTVFLYRLSLPEANRVSAMKLCCGVMPC